MMTREELESDLAEAVNEKYSRDRRNVARLRIFTHDAEQRAEIVGLREWQRIILGSGTEQESVIRMAAAEYTQTAIRCWKDKCEQQAQEIARLREALEVCKRELWHCNKQLVTNGWKEGVSVTRALEQAKQALKESTP